MKTPIKFLELSLLIMSTQLSVIAQNINTDDGLALKRRVYKVSLVTANSKKTTGYLTSLSDSNLFLSQSPFHFNLVKRDRSSTAYSYDHLENIQIKRKGAAGRGAWQGALIGLAVGVVAGFASGDDPVAPYYNDPNDPLGTGLGNLFVFTSNAFAMTAGEKAVAGGFLGAGAGSLIGLLVGSLVKKKFIIGRNKEKFHEMRQNILKKLYVHKQEALQAQE